MFEEVWGIGPATALKLYEKGHRTLDELKNEESLTYAQRVGLKYIDDIKTRIPRHKASFAPQNNTPSQKKSPKKSCFFLNKK